MRISESYVYKVCPYSSSYANLLEVLQCSENKRLNLS